MTQLTIGVIFGSRSVEHDVSIVTATQVMKALNPEKYTIVPIYIARNGRWYTGENLKTLRNFKIDDITQLAGIQETHLSSNTEYPGLITPPLAGRLSKNKFQPLDVIFPVIHGSHGEDGTIQGLFEMVNLPYVGTGVLASAIANDKVMTKTLLKAQNLPVIEPYVSFGRSEWEAGREERLKRIATEVGFPCFVKPRTLGSSIGIAAAKDAEKAALHIDIALNMDRMVIVERAAQSGGEQIVEINCAVLGSDTTRASTLEQPVVEQGKDFLDYAGKYEGQPGQGMKSQERILPAPIDEQLTEKMQHTAVEAFRAICGTGTARIDFLLAPESGDFWVNEINTMPGSLAFYLWEPEGMSPGDVCDELIQDALAEHANKRQTTYNYKSKLIELADQRGTKGVKS